MEQKQGFSDWVKRRLRQRGHTQHSLAKAVGVNPNTFRSTYLRSNSWPEEVAVRVCAELGEPMTADQIVQTCKLAGGGFATQHQRESAKASPSHEAALALDKKQPDITSVLREQQELFHKVIRGMQDKDVYVASTLSVTPLEMQEGDAGEELRLSLAKALWNGAVALYLRPSEDYLRAFERRWPFRKMLAFDKAESELMALRRYLAKVMVTLDLCSPKQKTEAEEAAHTRVVQCYFDDNPFSQPGLVCGMVRYYYADRVKAMRRGFMMHHWFNCPMWIRHEAYESRIEQVAIDCMTKCSSDPPPIFPRLINILQDYHGLSSDD